MSDVSGGLTPAQKTAIENATTHGAAANPHSGHGLKIENQNNVTGSRAVNVIYQNTGQTLMLISIVTHVGSSSGKTTLISDSNASPTNDIGASTMLATDKESVFGVVLPNHYYKLLADGAVTATLDDWVEWS